MTKTFIIQHLPSSGDFDYSEYASIEAAWEAEKSESWVQTEMEEGDKTMEECRKEFSGTLREYTEEEVLDAILTAMTGQRSWASFTSSRPPQRRSRAGITVTWCVHSLPQCFQRKAREIGLARRVP